MAPRSLLPSLVVSLSTISLIGACGDNAALRGPDVDAPVDDDLVTPGIGIAVVNSNFTVTSISLLSRSTAQLAVGDCINSGARPPGTTLALSGDVVLPSWPLPNHDFVLIDRRNGTLTWIDPATCAPVRQLDVATGFLPIRTISSAFRRPRLT